MVRATTGYPRQPEVQRGDEEVQADRDRGGGGPGVPQDVVGDFAVGKEFDALVVDTTESAVFDVFPEDTPLDAFQKFINLGDDRNIKAVFVRGRRVRG